jgi:hypothetical protein
LRPPYDAANRSRDRAARAPRRSAAAARSMSRP